MNKYIILAFILIMNLSFGSTSFSAQDLIAIRTASPPIIDGIGSDSAWDASGTVTTHDPIAGIDITLQALYSDDEVFFKVSFPDADESRTHKSWIWNKARETYMVGDDIEDIFVFKWNMNNLSNDLSIYTDKPHVADTWFWKACRTDPVGYADDKMHLFEKVKSKNATEIITKSGKTMWLTRIEDLGDSAYKTVLQTEYYGEQLRRYENQTPSGSRADVKAKGAWFDNTWTIEFSRSLKTGHDDDIQFDPSKKYKFGMSRFEVAGRETNIKLTQPLYGTGDVNEIITLVFDKH